MGSQTHNYESSQLPVVDFTDETMKPGTDAWLSACHVVRAALEDHGCFAARFDKVGKELCNALISHLDELFGLPLETKSQKISEKLFHHYFGQVPFIPLHESLAIDNPLSADGCQKFTTTMWPEGKEHFSERINEYSKILGELDRLSMRMVFESYGVDMQRCDSFLESNNYLLRCLKHRAPQMDEDNVGLQAHTDLTVTSIVHQLNNLDGLEIKLKDGEWISVDASPSIFVVMAGDALNVWSNGNIRPCEHRVIMNAKQTRYSMGLFSFYSKVMEIPEEVVNEEHPLRYKPTFDHYDYVGFFDKMKIKETYPRIQAYCGI